jgi:hypothetical protein
MVLLVVCQSSRGMLHEKKPNINYFFHKFEEPTTKKQQADARAVEPSTKTVAMDPFGNAN